jgi:hypothetical protein
MKLPRPRNEVRCDFCRRLLQPGENFDDWQLYAAIDPGNVWYELLACPQCRDDPKKRKAYYREQVAEGE